MFIDWTFRQDCELSQELINNLDMTFRYNKVAHVNIIFILLEVVNAFEYLDDKNRERLQNIKEKLVNQGDNLSYLKERAELLLAKLESNMWFCIFEN